MSAQHTLAKLCSLQDWLMRFQLTKASGVAEVASAGGFEKRCQSKLDARKLQAFGIPLSRVTEAVRGSSRDVGYRAIEMTETEHMVRSCGDLTGTGDLDRVQLGPDERRGIGKLDGTGKAVGSIVVVKRDAADALTTVQSVKRRLAEVLPSLLEGVSIQAVYDRSELIKCAIANLRQPLVEESLIAFLVCVVFLVHVRSALVAILTLPIGAPLAALALRTIGVGSNIPSLGGTAIVMIENAHKHVERFGPGEPRGPALIAAAQEVGPSLFFSLLIIVVSFLSVFALQGQEGRTFRPLA